MKVLPHLLMCAFQYIPYMEQYIVDNLTRASSVG